jgi:hypothetical protein
MVFTAAPNTTNACFSTRAILQQNDRAITGDWIVTTPGNNTRGDISGTLTDDDDGNDVVHDAVT